MCSLPRSSRISRSQLRYRRVSSLASLPSWTSFPNFCSSNRAKRLVAVSGEQSFDSFSLDWYSPLDWPGESVSPRANMEFLYDLCLNYAQKFGRFYFKNLFLTGDPGLGKTFLSACIAKVVSENQVGADNGLLPGGEPVVDERIQGALGGGGIHLGPQIV